MFVELMNKGRAESMREEGKGGKGTEKERRKSRRRKETHLSLCSPDHPCRTSVDKLGTFS